MKSVYQILKSLESTSSTNEKLSIIKNNADNNLLKIFFKLALDKTINFYIKKIPAYSTVHDLFRPESLSLDSAYKKLSILSERQKTGHAGRDHLINILENCSESNALVIERIIKKDPNCGVSYATVNKVWPNLIELWPVMLCERYSENAAENVKEPYVVQDKEDGMRMEILVAKNSPIEHKLVGRIEKGDVQFRTRNGNIMDMCDHLKKECLNFVEYNSVLDGEGLIWENGEYLDRKSGNGILNKSIQGTINAREQASVRLKLWDIINPDDFFNRKSNIKYDKRFLYLKKLFFDKKDEIEKITLVKTNFVKNLVQARRLYARAAKKGKEGIILKSLSSIWENDRSKQQIKFKNEFEADLLIIETVPHKKKPNMIGALICESACSKLKVKVGSGLKKKDQEKEPNYYIGKIVQIVFNELISSKGKETWSLFLPRFDEMRFDKDVPETLTEIKQKIKDKLELMENEQ